MLKEILRDNTDACLDLMDTADLTICDKKSGLTLLQIAITNRNPILIRALLKKVDVDQRNKDGHTATFTAITNNYLEGVQLCLQAKCDVECLIDGRSYLYHAAAAVDNVEMLDLLIRHKVPGGEVLHAALNNDLVENAIYLIQHQVDLSLQDQDGDTALHLAAENGYAEVLKAIVEQANKNKECKLGNITNKEGNTALHVAAIAERELFTQMMVENADILQLDLNKKNKAGLTYQMIIDDIQLKKERERDDMIIRKRQNAEEKFNRAEQRRQETLDKLQQEQDDQIRRKQQIEQAKQTQVQQEKQTRMMMIGTIVAVLFGFYLVLQLSIGA